MVQVKEYISQSEFCRRLAISKRALFLAKRNGRVKVEEGEQNHNKMEWHEQRDNFVQTSTEPERYSEAAIRERKLQMKNGKNCSVYTSGSQIRQKKKAKTNGNGHHPIDDIEGPSDDDGDFMPNMNRAQAESVKQVYLAKQAKLKFLKEAGTLIEAEVVKKEWEEIAVRVQKAMLSIPDRVAEIFASLTDADKIHKSLDKEIRYALSSLQYKVKSEDEHGRVQEVVEAESESAKV